MWRSDIVGCATFDDDDGAVAILCLQLLLFNRNSLDADALDEILKESEDNMVQLDFFSPQNVPLYSLRCLSCLVVDNILDVGVVLKQLKVVGWLILLEC